MNEPQSVNASAPLTGSLAPTCKYFLKWSYCGDVATHQVASTLSNALIPVCEEHAEPFRSSIYHIVTKLEKTKSPATRRRTPEPQYEASEQTKIHDGRNREGQAGLCCDAWLDINVKTIQVKLTVDVPKVPNFLRTSDGQSVPLCAVTDDGLRELAAEWTKQLIERSHQQQHNQSGGDDV